MNLSARLGFVCLYFCNEENEGYWENPLNLQIPNSRPSHSLNVSLYHFTLCVEGRTGINLGRNTLEPSSSFSLLPSEESRSVGILGDTDFVHTQWGEEPWCALLSSTIFPCPATMELGLPHRMTLGPHLQWSTLSSHIFRLNMWQVLKGYNKKHAFQLGTKGTLFFHLLLVCGLRSRFNWDQLKDDSINSQLVMGLLWVQRNFSVLYKTHEVVRCHYGSPVLYLKLISFWT